MILSSFQVIDNDEDVQSMKDTDCLLDYENSKEEDMRLHYK